MDSNNKDTAIQIKHVTKTYKKIVAVDDISLTIFKGELFALLGPNGAGKTTTIKMLCGLSKPSSGSAMIMGYDTQMDASRVKQVINVSPQETAIAGHLNAWENLALIGGIHGLARKVVNQNSEALLARMGLNGRAKDQTKKYSGGMKRRLSIAMSLISDPQVVFLDEPTLGLDPQSRRILWEQIQELKGKKTIILTTHYLEEADFLADRIAVMDEGKIIALGTPSELKSRITGNKTMIVKAHNFNNEIVQDLRDKYCEVKEIDGGVEISDNDLTFSEIVDYLRPKGITIESTSQKEVTLDDVYLSLTGKELRQ